MFEDMNTRRQGDCGVAAAVMYFTINNFSVSKPLADSQRYDLIVDRDGVLSRVECKTTSHKPRGNVYVVTLATSGGNQSGTGEIKSISTADSEYVFILCSNGTQYLIPTVLLHGRAKMSLGVEWNDYIIAGNPVEYRRPDGIIVLPEPKYCGSCNSPVNRKTDRCKKCIDRTTIEWPDDSKLLDMVKQSNFVQVGKKLGVSDNAVRKRLKGKGYDPKNL